jgi:hypothetical protein
MGVIYSRVSAAKVSLAPVPVPVPALALALVPASALALAPEKPLVRFNMSFKVDKHMKGTMKRILKYDRWDNFISNMMRESIQIENKALYIPIILDTITCTDIRIHVSKWRKGYSGNIQWTSVSCNVNHIVESIASNIIYEVSFDLNPLRTFNMEPQHIWKSSLDSEDPVDFDDPEKIESDSMSE